MRHFWARFCTAVEMGGVIYSIRDGNERKSFSFVEALPAVNLEPPKSHIQTQASTFLSLEIPPLEEMTHLHPAPMLSITVSQEEQTHLRPTLTPAVLESQPDQRPSSQSPQTLQLLQSKFPTADFTPVAAEVVQVEGTLVSQPSTAMPVGQNLINATTEEVCQWLSKHGISKASLDILRREEIDGVFLFKESADEIKSVLKDEGVKAGQISRIRHVVEDAKREGSLV